MSSCVSPLVALLLCGSGAAALSIGNSNAGRAGSSQAANSGVGAHAAQWRACTEADVEERRYWAVEWSDLEADLKRLYAVAAPNATALPTAAKKHRKSPLAGLHLNLEPKTAADLIPALAMLKGLYEDGKERIGHLNVREKKYKEQFEKKTAEHEQSMAAIDARFKNSTLSADWRANATKEENRLWSYWERVRQRQHAQYHTSLKIQHGTLEKVKLMIGAYEQTISGHADKAAVAKELQKAGGGALPDIVFLQDARTAAAEFCEGALTELHAAREEGQKEVGEALM